MTIIQEACRRALGTCLGVGGGAVHQAHWKADSLGMQKKEKCNPPSSDFPASLPSCVTLPTVWRSFLNLCPVQGEEHPVLTMMGTSSRDQSDGPDASSVTPLLACIVAFWVPLSHFCLVVESEFFFNVVEKNVISFYAE